MKYCDQCRSSYPNEFNVCPIDNSPLRQTSEIFPGITIRDKYLILEKVGEGGMGAVYRARHLAFNETVALKVVHSSMAEDPGFIKRFKTEAIIARRLRHPNAVRVHDLDSTEDGRPFIVMEMVEGDSLKALIAQFGSFPFGRAIDIAIQTAEALAAAHRLGIVHRDIKPDNILITAANDGRDLVKVVDFGIAKVREGAIDVGGGYTATRTGMIVGTPQYLSPEQATGMHGDEIDGRVDIYSLGVVLYVMLTGQLPFESNTPMGFLIQHVQTQPIAPHLARPDLDIPVELSAILMKALEKDRDCRFRSADEMALALRCVPGYLQEIQLLDHSSLSTPKMPPVTNSHAGLVTPGMPRTPTPRPESVKIASPRDSHANKQQHDINLSQPMAGLRRTGVWVAITTAIVVSGGLGGLYLYLNFDANHRNPVTRPVATSAPSNAEKAIVPVISDQEIRSSIERSLATVQKRASIQVAVQNGIVTLTGKCPLEADCVEAENLASHVSGVTIVRNQTEVESANRSTASATKPANLKPASSKNSGPDSAVTTHKVDKATIESLMSAGKQAAENGEYDRAIASYQEVLRHDPKNAIAQAGLARATKAKQTEEQVLNPH